MFFRKKYEQLEYPYNNLGQLTKRFIPRKDRNPNTEGYYDTYRKAVRHNDPDWAQKNLEATKRYIQSDKDSKADLAAMPNYHKRITEANKKRQTKEWIPLFPVIDWLNTGLHGGGWEWRE
jgi:hypothetical protein